MTRKPDDHILQPASIVQEQRLSSTSITVSSRKELRQAVKSRAAEIVIDDPALARVLERHLSKDSSSRVFYDPASAPVFRVNVQKKVSAWSELRGVLTPARIILALGGLIVLALLLLAVFATEIFRVVIWPLLFLLLGFSIWSVFIIAMDREYDEIGASYKWRKDSKSGNILLKRRSNGGEGS